MGKQQSDKPQGRHAEEGRGTGRPAREPLRDNYYYEQPPRHSREPMEFEDISSSSQGGGEFQDISSYSSDRQRQQDQRELRQARQPRATLPAPGESRPGGGAPQGRETPRKPRKSAGRRVLSSRPGCAGGGPGGPGPGRSSLCSAGLRVSPLSGDLADGGRRLFRQQGEEHRPVRGGPPGTTPTRAGPDVLAILTVDNRRGTLKLTSILRDSQVYIEGYGYDKATHAYAYGGPELAVRTLTRPFTWTSPTM